VAEVVAQEITLGDDGKIDSYRTKLRVSFKYEK
jgi:flavin-binding protein dodecin